jgi:CDP-L-myo-inositol myo-inositolphosphotransferase
LSSNYDGYISKYCNRKISDPIAKLLSKTKITPNQVTWISFVISIVAFILFVADNNITAGLIAQFSSIVDGVDGKLARLTNKVTVFGGFLDSVLDRYSDMFLILGLIIWSSNHEQYPLLWLIGIFSITGTIGISYTRARINEELRSHFDSGWLSLASRDIRIFVIMLGAILGQAYLCLAFLGALTHLMIFSRIIFIFLHLEKKS